MTGPKPSSNRGNQEFAETIGVVTTSAISELDARVEIPELSRGGAARSKVERGAGAHRADALEERLAAILVGKPFEKEEGSEGILVRPGGDIRVGEDRLDFRAEDEGPAVGPVVQRSTADRVARDDQPARTAIEQGEGELALKTAEEFFAPFPPRGQNQRRIRSIRQGPAPCHRRQQRLPVVQAAVEH